jgi:hypothetical protein
LGCFIIIIIIIKPEVTPSFLCSNWVPIFALLSMILPDQCSCFNPTSSKAMPRDQHTKLHKLLRSSSSSQKEDAIVEIEHGISLTPVHTTSGRVECSSHLQHKSAPRTTTLAIVEAQCHGPSSLNPELYKSTKSVDGNFDADFRNALWYTIFEIA